ncbi:MAG: hypothetical protein AB7G48_10325 [Nitrospiraceae bacterium]
MICAELATGFRCGPAPIVLILNHHRYSTERDSLKERFNDIPVRRDKKEMK